MIQKFGDEISWEDHVNQVLQEKDILFGVQEDSLIIKNIKKYAKGDDLVDFGCHVGRWSKFFNGAGFNYLGVDQSELALENAKKINPEVSFTHSFLWEFNPEKKFDVGIFIAVLQHNKLEEQERIISNISKYIKSGGVLFMTESTMLGGTATQRTHDGWIDLMERNNFIFMESWHKNEFGLEDHYIFIRK
jgi:2-polyprenyl-3-methyl-5-hydroxy-6-metoxy-1,4-benzoquinol methylase